MLSRPLLSWMTQHIEDGRESMAHEPALSDLRVPILPVLCVSSHVPDGAASWQRRMCEKAGKADISRIGAPGFEPGKPSLLVAQRRIPFLVPRLRLGTPCPGG